MDSKVKYFLAQIGITGIDNADCPVFEDNYIKFMSDGGTTDDAQGDMFKVWLDGRGYTYERNRGRSFRNLDSNAVAELERLSEEVWPEDVI